VLDCESRLHDMWNDTEERGKGVAIVAVVSDAGVDNLPEPHRLKVHLYNQRPFHVVGAG
jgi:hypothetical protein